MWDGEVVRFKGMVKIERRMEQMKRRQETGGRRGEEGKGRNGTGRNGKGRVRIENEKEGILGEEVVNGKESESREDKRRKRSKGKR